MTGLLDDAPVVRPPAGGSGSRPLRTVCELCVGVVAGECVPERGTRGDAELREDLVRCDPTVRWDRKSRSPISLLLMPAAASRAISSCCGDSALGSSDLGASDGDAGGAHLVRGPLRPRARAETVERVECGGELSASRSCLLGSSEPLPKASLTPPGRRPTVLHQGPPGPCRRTRRARSRRCRRLPPLEGQGGRRSARGWLGAPLQHGPRPLLGGRCAPRLPRGPSPPTSHAGRERRSSLEG